MALQLYVPTSSPLCSLSQPSSSHIKVLHLSSLSLISQPKQVFHFSVTANKMFTLLLFGLWGLATCVIATPVPQGDGPPNGSSGPTRGCDQKTDTVSGFKHPRTCNVMLDEGPLTLRHRSSTILEPVGFLDCTRSDTTTELSMMVFSLMLAYLSKFLIMTLTISPVRQPCSGQYSRDHSSIWLQRCYSRSWSWHPPTWDFEPPSFRQHRRRTVQFLRPHLLLLRLRPERSDSSKSGCSADLRHYCYRIRWEQTGPRREVYIHSDRPKFVSNA